MAVRCMFDRLDACHTDRLRPLPHERRTFASPIDMRLGPVQHPQASSDGDSTSDITPSVPRQTGQDASVRRISDGRQVMVLSVFRMKLVRLCDATPLTQTHPIIRRRKDNSATSSTVASRPKRCYQNGRPKTKRSQRTASNQVQRPVHGWIAGQPSLYGGDFAQATSPKALVKRIEPRLRAEHAVPRCEHVGRYDFATRIRVPNYLRTSSRAEILKIWPTVRLEVLQTLVNDPHIRIHSVKIWRGNQQDEHAAICRHPVSRCTRLRSSTGNGRSFARRRCPEPGSGFERVPTSHLIAP